jgi:hypothetical protein
MFKQIVVRTATKNAKRFASHDVLSGLEGLCLVQLRDIHPLRSEEQEYSKETYEMYSERQIRS